MKCMREGKGIKEGRVMGRGKGMKEEGSIRGWHGVKGQLLEEGRVHLKGKGKC